MTLAELRITGLRNITSAHLHFHPHINLISGNNGSGKTSLLEAIYLLGTGHSFRSRDLPALITYQHDYLALFARNFLHQEISLQKSLHQTTLAKIQGALCQSSSELATFLPVQLIYQNMFQFLDEGPALRRMTLDWGMFHVEHDYHAIWKDYRRALKQRNALLKQSAALSLITPWDLVLSELADRMDCMRSAYVSSLNHVFCELVKELGDLNCHLSYYRGWDRKNENKPLFEILQNSFSRDGYRQYTHYGAHHADLLISTEQGLAKHGFSRGQQKLILLALKLSQASLLPKPCLFLMDDLASELDEHSIEQVCRLLNKVQGQIYLTARPADVALFKLKVGQHIKVDQGKFINL